MGRTCTLKGNPLSLAGEALKVGQSAPDAKLRKDLVSDYQLSEANGSVRILSVVPSLDTGVCALQTKRFNEEAAGLPNVKIFTISTDLPMAQGRFCGAEGIDAEKITCLSDHKDIEFGNAYGTLIPDLRVECRAVFVIDAENVIQYAEYVPEVAEHPDYDAVLACVKGL
jgi:thiol peroxidase